MVIWKSTTKSRNGWKFNHKNTPWRSSWLRDTAARIGSFYEFDRSYWRRQSDAQISGSKVGCVFPIVVFSLLNQAGFRPNDYWEHASHFKCISSRCIWKNYDLLHLKSSVWTNKAFHVIKLGQCGRHKSVNDRGRPQKVSLLLIKNFSGYFFVIWIILVRRIFWKIGFFFQSRDAYIASLRRMCWIVY